MAYSKLRSIRARERISWRVLELNLSSPSAAAQLRQSDGQAQTSHDLYQQRRSLIGSGSIEEAADCWQNLCRDLPLPINFLCCARVLLAKNDLPNAFTILVDGTERYPFDVPLALELATFFLRLDDVEAANVAFEPVRDNSSQHLRSRPEAAANGQRSWRRETSCRPAANPGRGRSRTKLSTR